MPEAVPVLEQIIWNQDRETAGTILALLTYYKSANLISLAHEYLARVDTMRQNENPFFKEDIPQLKYKVTSCLFRMGDYSTFQYVFDKIERLKPKTFFGSAVMLKRILFNVPGYELQAKTELLRIISDTDSEERQAALDVLAEKYGDSVSVLVKSTFANTSDEALRSRAMKLMLKYDHPEIKDLLYARFLADTIDNWLYVGVILKKYPTPAMYELLLQSLNNITSNNQSIGTSLFIFEPPKPDTSTSVLQMVQNLNSLIDTSYGYGWIGNASFMQELKGYMNTALNKLQNGDSLSCAIEVQRFSDTVYAEFADSLERTQRFVGLGGMNFLYYNALYALERLPSVPVSTKLDVLTPAIAFTGYGGFALEVSGKGFTSASKVLWNDSVRTTTFVSDSLLRASILASDVATVGDKIVRVKYDSASSALSDSMVFSVVNTLPKPVRLVIEKEIDSHNGTMTAWFGYLNVNDRSVYIPVGDKNSFTPTPIDRGQATIFLPGRHKYVFGVTFPNTINIEWQLNGRRAKAGSVCED